MTYLRERLDRLDATTALTNAKLDQLIDMRNGIDTSSRNATQPIVDHDVTELSTRLSRLELLLFRVPLSEFKVIDDHISAMLPGVAPFKSDHIDLPFVPAFPYRGGKLIRWEATDQNDGANLHRDGNNDEDVKGHAVTIEKNEALSTCLRFDISDPDAPKASHDSEPDTDPKDILWSTEGVWEQLPQHAWRTIHNKFGRYDKSDRDVMSGQNIADDPASAHTEGDEDGKQADNDLLTTGLTKEQDETLAMVRAVKADMAEWTARRQLGFVEGFDNEDEAKEEDQKLEDDPVDKATVTMESKDVTSQNEFTEPVDAPVVDSFVSAEGLSKDNQVLLDALRALVEDKLGVG